MATSNPEGSGFVALATFAAMGLTLGTAILMQRSQMIKQQEDAKEALRRERKKHRQRYRQTVEY